jgi:5-methylthioadenosine/S-adenosylhomocysteine deaminase
MEREIGSLEKGKRADLILVETSAAHLLPLYNVYSQLVYSIKGCDVRTSIINGKVVMLEGKVLTMNEQRVLQKAREYQLIVGSR